ncbi:MAG: CDP-diacylglycerol--glycerol-3-phosphate 3-phosphatidyltransferase [Bdellovibrionales bacterium]|nr:CDP-diacylglycerol--glycerol-3-phosphate 3-phosphatidyltransferase [Bdellovibrionales bacterium]
MENDKTSTGFIGSLPNYLTYLRLALVPVFVVLMHNPAPWMLDVAIVIFVLASLTDYFDGFLARKYGAISDTGKLLDPIADKILVMAALIMLVAQRSDVDGEPWVPGWLVVLLLAREIWITGLRSVAASRGMVIAANDTGKIKSFCQMVGIVFLLIHHPLKLFGVAIPCEFVGVNLLFLSLALSLWSAWDYTLRVYSQES